MAEGLELKLLVTCGRLFLGTANDDEALQYLRLPLDWSRLFDKATKEGMSGLLHSEVLRLARANNLDLPVDQHAQALRHIFARNGAYFAELLAIREALRQRGLQAIVLKGGALIEAVYGGRRGLRPLSDLDILVRSSDYSSFEEVLLERGFRPDFPSSTFFTKGSLAFDLHTDLTGAEWVRRKALAFRFDAEALWREASPLDGQDPTLLVLSPLDQFLHLAVHALKHSFSRLIWLVDLGLVSRHLKWEDLVDLAKASGTLRPLAYALFGLENLMGVEAPPEIQASLPQPNRLERMFLSSVVSRRAMETPGEVIVAFSIPGLPGKLSYLSELVFPQRQVLARHYPFTRPWLLYPRRLFRVVTLGIREGRKVVGI